MNEDLFAEKMDALVIQFREYEFEDSLRQARELKAELLAENTTDPEQLGFARFYEFKNLYELEEFEEFGRLLDAEEPKPFQLSINNQSWVQSVGAEAAFHLDRPEDVLRRGAECIRIRAENEDLDGVFMAANTVCILLRNMSRAELNGPFASELFEKGDGDDPEWFLRGAMFLLDNFDSSGEKDPAARVLAEQTRVQELAETSEDLKEQAREILERLKAMDPGQAALNKRLREAAQDNDPAGVRRALEEGAQLNAKQKEMPGLPTALMAAAFSGALESLTELLQHEPNLEITNENGRTALHMAAAGGSLECTRSLVEAGADVEARDMFEASAWETADAEDEPEIVAYLEPILTARMNERYGYTEDDEE